MIRFRAYLTRRLIQDLRLLTLEVATGHHGGVIAVLSIGVEVALEILQPVVRRVLLRLRQGGVAALKVIRIRVVPQVVVVVLRLGLLRRSRPQTGTAAVVTVAILPAFASFTTLLRCLLLMRFGLLQLLLRSANLLRG